MVFEMEREEVSGTRCNWELGLVFGREAEEQEPKSWPSFIPDNQDRPVVFSVPANRRFERRPLGF